MIVDAIHHDDGPPTLYTRWRDDEGKLMEKRVHNYYPHMFIPCHTSEFRINTMLRSFPTARILKDEVFEGLDGTKLWKVEADSSYDIFNMSKTVAGTYEADVFYQDQYLINNVAEMPRWKPRKWWYDIECDTGDDNFTTVIAVIDSDLDTPVVFAWADERTNCPYTQEIAPKGRPVLNRKVRDEEYKLRLFNSEKEMYDDFIRFLNERNPDMMIAHAGTFFDIPHMIERLDKIYGQGGASKLSPLGIIRYPKRGERYRYDAQPIAGRWQFDTAAPEGSGTGFERVWKDSGGGQLPNLKLNTIAETLGLGSKLTEEIDGMTVHNGW